MIKMRQEQLALVRSAASLTVVLFLVYSIVVLSFWDWNVDSYLLPRMDTDSRYFYSLSLCGVQSDNCDLEIPLDHRLPALIWRLFYSLTSLYNIYSPMVGVLFNSFLTALSVGFLYLYSCTQRHDERIIQAPTWVFCLFGISGWSLLSATTYLREAFFISIATIAAISSIDFIAFYRSRQISSLFLAISVFLMLFVRIESAFLLVALFIITGLFLISHARPSTISLAILVVLLSAALIFKESYLVEKLLSLLDISSRSYSLPIEGLFGLVVAPIYLLLFPIPPWSMYESTGTLIGFLFMVKSLTMLPLLPISIEIVLKNQLRKDLIIRYVSLCLVLVMLAVTYTSQNPRHMALATPFIHILLLRSYRLGLRLNHRIALGTLILLVAQICISFFRS